MHRDRPSPTEPKTTLYIIGLIVVLVKSDCRNVHGFCVTLGLYRSRPSGGYRTNTHNTYAYAYGSLRSKVYM